MSRKYFRRLISALLAIILIFDMSAINAPVRSYAADSAPSWPQFIEDGGSFSINSTDLTEDPFAFHVVYFQSLKGCNALLGSDPNTYMPFPEHMSDYPGVLGYQQKINERTFDSLDATDPGIYGWKYAGYQHLGTQSFLIVYVAQYKSVVCYDIDGNEDHLVFDEVKYYYDENGDAKDTDYTVKSAEALGVSREGYAFNGWLNDSDVSVPVGEIINVEGINPGFRADWYEELKVSYAPGEGKGTAFYDYVDPETPYKLREDADFTREGYILSGWKTSEGIVYEPGMLYYSDLGNLELTAVWTEKTKITYSPGEGKGDVITDYLDSDQKYNLRSDADFTRDGYDLTGWKDSKGKQYELGASYDHSLGDLELTAVWTEKIKITYAPGEGKGTAVTDTVGFDETYSLRDKADFTRDGYKLSGWKDKAGNEYALGASYDLKKGSIELTAMWEASVKTGKAKIRYAPGDGSGTAITDEVNFKYVSESKAEDYNLRKTADFTRKGYKLIGWKAADGTEYALGASYNLAGGDLSLTAVWEKVKEEEKTEQKKGTLTISVNRPVYFGAKIKVETKTNSNGKVTLEYKKQDEADSAYSTKVPELVGKYTVRAKLAETKKYTGTSATEDFEIVYLAVPEEPYKYTEIKDAAGTITDLKITAPEGYRISLSASGPFGTEVSYLAAKAAGTIFLRRDTDGAITSGIVPQPYTVMDDAKITIKDKIYYGTKYSVEYTAHTKAKLSLSYRDTEGSLEYTDVQPTKPGHYMVRLAGEADGFYKAVDWNSFFDINYLEKPEEKASLLGESINAGWYVSDVTVKAPQGYKISTSLAGNYVKEMPYKESIKMLYYKRDADGATTDGITFKANVKIDKEKPSIKSMEGKTPKNGGTVYSNGLTFTIYDEYLKEVILDDDDQLEIKDHSCIINIPADKKLRNVKVIAYDEAGNTYELKFTMLPAWREFNTVPRGEDVYLEEGLEYKFDKEVGDDWILKDDSTVYSAGTFFVKKSTDYNFDVKTK